MLLYSAFYRRFGIRRPGDLSEPGLHGVGVLELPKESVVQFLTYDDFVQGPEPEHPFYKHHTGRVMVQHVGALVDPIGSPRPNRTKPEAAIRRDFHRRFRSMRPMHDINKSLRDPKTLVTLNYAPMTQLHLYTRSIYSGYYKWHNVIKSALVSVNATMIGNDRQHFMPIELPKRIPNRVMFMKATQDFTSYPRKLLDVLARPQYQILVELWKWLGPEREKSSFNALQQDHYDRLNLVFLDGDRWFVMNLGAVLNIAKMDEDEDEGSTKLQRRFLRMLISVVERRTVIGDSDELEEAIKDVPQPTTQAEVTPEVDDAGLDDDVLEPEDDNISDAALDADLARLDNVEDDEQEFDVVQADVVVDPKARVMQQAERMAEKGALSAAQYRRVGRLIDKAKDLPNPFGEGTLDEFRKITPEDVAITEKDIQIPKLEGVSDESMLRSTLKAFDRKYLTEVFDKDVANCAMAIEQAGVIVTDYAVNEVKTIGNHYKEVTMKIAPIDGEASTVRFKVPVVDDEGQFVSNGVPYKLRKQRADKPIRKVDPHTVSLTSYYAKVFVERSQRVVVNYPKWLSKQITAIGLDNDDPRVTDLKRVKTFDHDIKVPRIYSTLAEYFRGFTVNNKYRLFVDYTRRTTVFDEATLTRWEKDGMLVVGWEGRDVILIDENSVFYSTKGGKVNVIGRIEEMIGLDASKAPVEIAEFRLFSKNVPVVVALGLRYGLSQLMSVLNVTPRRVGAGQPLALQTDEYAVKFADETLVFSRDDDKKASLIFAGFNRYHRSIRQYTVDSFDNPDVYSNLMEENGHRVGFVREMEMAMEMFVDPITDSLLEEMGEPRTLEGLLIRACELLTTDDHPAETDMDAMRIRGYERMAGAVYGEISKSVRRFRSRGIGQAAKMEMNPNAVWMNINLDSSVGQVEESNPIENLKEQELVTYTGTGGRTSDTMVKRTRAYHKSDVGVISEATTDSGTVGVNTYLTANPQFTNVRGITRTWDAKRDGAAATLSTSAMMAPMGDMDEVRRLNTRALCRVIYTE